MLTRKPYAAYLTSCFTIGDQNLVKKSCVTVLALVHHLTNYNQNQAFEKKEKKKQHWAIKGFITFITGMLIEQQDSKAKHINNRTCGLGGQGPGCVQALGAYCITSLSNSFSCRGRSRAVRTGLKARAIQHQLSETQELSSSP